MDCAVRARKRKISIAHSPRHCNADQLLRIQEWCSATSRGFGFLGKITSKHDITASLFLLEKIGGVGTTIVFQFAIFYRWLQVNITLMWYFERLNSECKANSLLQKLRAIAEISI